MFATNDVFNNNSTFAIDGKEGWEIFKIIENGLTSSSSDDNNKKSKNNEKIDDKTDYDNNDKDESIWRPMLWISHPGVTAQTHYDTQHNVFIQIQVIKKILLFPISSELFSYPNIHRSYRQSQLHFEDNNNLKEKLIISNKLVFESSIVQEV